MQITNPRIFFGEQYLNTGQGWLPIQSSVKDNGIETCQSCNTTYQWPKSGATLKMTYCSVSCEQKDLGFHIDSFIRKDGYEIVKSDLKTKKSDHESLEDLTGDELNNIVTNLSDEDDDDNRELVPI